MLTSSESTDPDEIRNNDGDVVVDPPEDWSEAAGFGVTEREEEEGESLDARLAAEERDLAAEERDEFTDSIGDDGPGRAYRGQVSGAPEDGDSLFDVVDEDE